MSNLWPEKDDSPAGKGDRRRTKSERVSQEEIDANWAKLLGNDKDEEE